MQLTCTVVIIIFNNFTVLSSGESSFSLLHTEKWASSIKKLAVDGLGIRLKKYSFSIKISLSVTFTASRVNVTSPSRVVSNGPARETTPIVTGTADAFFPQNNKAGWGDLRRTCQQELLPNKGSPTNWVTYLETMLNLTPVFSL